MEEATPVSQVLLQPLKLQNSFFTDSCVPNCGHLLSASTNRVHEFVHLCSCPHVCVCTHTSLASIWMVVTPVVLCSLGEPEVVPFSTANLTVTGISPGSQGKSFLSLHIRAKWQTTGNPQNCGRGHPNTLSKHQTEEVSGRA